MLAGTCVAYPSAFEEVCSDDGAYSVAPQVLRPRVAAAVTIEPGHRVPAALLQPTTQDIARQLLRKTHEPIIAGRCSSRAVMKSRPWKERFDLQECVVESYSQGVRLRTKTSRRRSV